MNLNSRGVGRLDGAGKLLVALQVDKECVRTFPVRNPVDAIGLCARLRRGGVWAEVVPCCRFWLDKPEVLMTFGGAMEAACKEGKQNADG